MGVDQLRSTNEADAAEAVVDGRDDKGIPKAPLVFELCLEQFRSQDGAISSISCCLENWSQTSAILPSLMCITTT